MTWHYLTIQENSDETEEVLIAEGLGVLTHKLPLEDYSGDRRDRCRRKISQGTLSTDAPQPPDQEEHNSKNNEQPQNVMTFYRLLPPVFSEVKPLFPRLFLRTFSNRKTARSVVSFHAHGFLEKSHDLFV